MFVCLNITIMIFVFRKCCIAIISCGRQGKNYHYFTDEQPETLISRDQPTVTARKRQGRVEPEFQILPQRPTGCERCSALSWGGGDGEATDQLHRLLSSGHSRPGVAYCFYMSCELRILFFFPG